MTSYISNGPSDNISKDSLQKGSDANISLGNNVQVGNLSSLLSVLVSNTTTSVNGPNQLVLLDNDGHILPSLIGHITSGVLSVNNRTGNIFLSGSDILTGIIDDSHIPSQLNGHVYDGLTNTNMITSFTISNGQASINVENNVGIKGSNGSKINIGNGGTLVRSAYIDTVDATNITVGTLANDRLPVNLYNHTYDGLTLGQNVTGFSIEGGIINKILTVNNNLTLKGNDNSVLNIDNGGTLVRSAYVDTVNASNITVGTLDNGRLPSILSNHVYDGITLTEQSTGFKIDGGINKKSLSVRNNLTLDGQNNSTLNVGPGGTLTNSAYVDTVNASNITVGTLDNNRLPSILSNHSYNGINLSTLPVGFTMVGGTSSKNLTVINDIILDGNGSKLNVLNDLTLSGQNNSTLNVGPGGTLTNSAFIDTVNASNITVGTLDNNRLPSILTNHSYNGINLTTLPIGFTMVGGTSSKNLTVLNDIILDGNGSKLNVLNDLTLSGQNNSTLNIGPGGTLTNSAFIDTVNASNITVGTLDNNRLPSILTNHVYDGLTVTAQNTGFKIDGGNVKKSLSILNNLTLSGNDNSILNINNGGTLVNSAYIDTVNASNITVGTLSNNQLPSILSNHSYNGLNIISLPIGFSLIGGTNSKNLTVSNSLNLVGTDNSTLDISNGGILQRSAYIDTVDATNITVGTLNNNRLPSILSNHVYDGITNVSLATGFTVSGGTNSKSLTVKNNLTMIGSDNSTLDIANGGSLVRSAYVDTVDATNITDGTLSNNRLPSILSNHVYDGITNVSLATGFTVSGGTISKSLTVKNNLNLTGQDNSNLDIANGGTLVRSAYVDTVDATNITDGTLNNSRLPSILSNHVYDGITLTSMPVGFMIGGGTTSKSLTVNNNISLVGSDNSTLNIANGGTLQRSAYIDTVDATNITDGTLSNSRIPSILSNHVYDGITLTSLATGFSLNGGTTNKYLTVNNNINIFGQDGSMLDISNGGTLVRSAFIDTVNATNITDGTLANSHLPSNLLGHTYENLTLTSLPSGFMIGGGTINKNLIVKNDLTFSGVDGSTIDFANGGTLQRSAYIDTVDATNITDGTLNNSRLPSILSNHVYDGITLTSLPIGFIVGGGTSSKSLTVNNNLSLSGQDNSTLDIANGGTLVRSAFIDTVDATNITDGTLSNNRLPSILSNHVYDGITNVSLATGFSVSGGTNSKSLTVKNNLLFIGTDGSTIDFANGGTLVRSAYIDTVDATNITDGTLSNNRLPSILTNHVYDGITNLSLATGFSLIGGTIDKSLTVKNNLTLKGNDNSALDIANGGTLVRSAYIDTVDASNITDGTLANGRLPSILSNHVYDGITLTSLPSGFSLNGGTINKYLTVNNNLLFLGVDGSTLDISNGGTLVRSAYVDTVDATNITDGTLANNRLPSILSNHVYDGITLTSLPTGFSVGGGTINKSLTVENNLLFVGVDGSIVDFANGGILQRSAYIDTVNATNITDGTLANNRLPSNLLGHTYENLTLTSLPSGFMIGGGTVNKSLTVNNDLTFTGNDGSTIDIANGGTLQRSAYIDTVDATNITDGTLNNSRLPSILSNHVYDGITLTSLPIGFMVGGGTTSKFLTVNNNLSLSGIDNSTLNISNGGTLQRSAYIDTVDATNITDGTLDNSRLPSILTGHVYDGIKNVSLNTGFSISGGTIGKSLTVKNDIMLSGIDGSTLNIANGGTLVRSAYIDTVDATNITVGTLSNNRIPSILSNHVYDGITLTSMNTGFSIGGGTTSKSLTVNNNIILSGNDNSTLNINNGGTLQNSAYTISTNNNIANTIVLRDNNGDFSANNITSNLTGAASYNVLKSGDIMTGPLLLADGTTIVPSLSFAQGTGNGLSHNTGTISLSTNSVERMNIGPSGSVKINNLNFVGLVHTDINGTLTSSQLINGDIAANASITDNKLATIVSSGKVANSATSANSSNVPNSIVSRDSNGNFSASMITANLTGSLFGNATTATTSIESYHASTATVANNFSGPVLGDVTGYQTNMTVSLVGGKSANSVANATSVVEASSTGNVLNTLVLRDGLGNFQANTITLNGPIVGPKDAVTKEYLDSVIISSIDPIEAAKVVATMQTPLTGLYTIDNVLVIDNDRILLIGQTNNIENGVWLAHSGSWTRPSDFMTGSNIQHTYVLILQGTFNSGSSYICNNPNSIVDTDPLTFIQFSIPGTTTGNNVGLGQGQIFRDKIGTLLNMKTLLQGSHVNIQNNVNDITLYTDATCANMNNTIISRDNFGNFAASIMTGNVIGNASDNILRSGDTMTGTLNIANSSSVRWQDASTGLSYIELKSKPLISGSYSLYLPTVGPLTGQKLMTSKTDSSQLCWLNGGTNSDGTVTRIIYVSTFGNDTINNGSIDGPYLTLGKALNIANTLSTIINPITIKMYPGTYIENNSIGPLIILSNGISIVGDSSESVIIKPSTLSNDLLTITSYAVLNNLQFLSGGLSSASCITISSTNKLVICSNLIISTFLNGLINQSSAILTLNDCIFNINNANNNSIGLTCNNALATINNCTFAGSGLTTGIYATGAGSINCTGGIFSLLGIGLSIDNNSVVSMIGALYKRCTIGCSVNGGRLNILSSEFVINNPTGNVTNIYASGTGTVVRCSNTIFSNLNLPSNIQTAVQTIGQAICTVIGGEIENYTNAFIIGQNGDTNTTQLLVTNVTVIGCTHDIIQLGQTKLNVQSANISTNKITINDSTYVQLSFFDTDNFNALNIGKYTDSHADIFVINIGQGSNNPELEYLPSLYGTQALGYNNFTTNATLYSAAKGNNNISSITSDRSKIASVQMFSDQGLEVGGNSALRGWTIMKKGGNSELNFSYQNTDTNGQIAINPYTILELDGLNNNINVPNPSTKIILNNDTNLYRDSSNTLKTDGNLIIGSLTANRVLIADSNKKITSSGVTNVELNYLANVSSSIQDQLNSKLNLSGGTVYGSITVTNGTITNPSINFANNTGLGFSGINDTLSISTANIERLNIDNVGSVKINGLNTLGIVHTDTNGTLTSSLIVNSDISTNSSITDNKLATISTVGKVANSATSAISANVPNTIVVRDGAGNFSANIITGNLFGTASNATNSINFSGNLLGDVTGVQGATVVNTVGGKPLVASAFSDTTNASNITIGTLNNSRLPTNLLGQTYNGLTNTALGTGFSIVGGTLAKSLTISNNLTLVGSDNSTLNINNGGTLVASAFSDTVDATNITVGTLNNGRLPSILTNHVYDGLTNTALATGFSISGGTVSKSLSISNNLTFSGVDNSTLNVSNGGTLVASAFSDTTNATNITSGTLNNNRIPSILSNHVYDGLTNTVLGTGFSISGGTVSKSLAISNNLTFSGVDNSTLNIVQGGTLVASAYSDTTNASNITVGTLNNSRIPSILTNHVYDGLTNNALATGFSISGGTVSKTLNISNNLTFSGVDNSTLNIVQGGTLVASAFSDTTNATNITSGTLNNSRIPSILTNHVYDGLSNNVLATGFSIAGGTISKSLSISNNLTFAGTDNSTLNIGLGGTLVASAFSDTTNATNITSGTLNNSRIPTALTGQTYNGLTNSALATGFSVSGGTVSKSLSVSNNLTLSGVDSSVLNIANGGTLVASAFSDTTNATNITSGTLNNTRLPIALTGQTYNGLTNTANATGFSIAGGTLSKTLFVSNNLTFSGVDSSTLNIGSGGTLVASAFSDTTNATNITSGTLNNSRLPVSLTGQTYNGLTNSALSTGFSIAGGTVSKTLSISNNLTFAGTDSSVLNISNGGTLVASAFSDTTNATNITSGTLNNARLPVSLTGQTYNGLTNTANGAGFSIAGGTISKTLNISNTLTFAGTDSSVLNIANGGTLVASAFSDTTNATNITAGTLNNSRLPATLTGQTYNGLTNSALATGFSIAGGTLSKTLNISNTLTLAGVDSSVLNIANGGTLVASAFSDTTNATNITSGTLNNARLPNALTGQTYNGLTNSALATGFSIAGGTLSKTLNISNTLTLSGVDSSVLNIGNGGTLIASAFSDTTNATNITSGTLNNNRLPATLTGQTYNGLTNSALATGFSIAGGTLSKTLNVSNTLTFAGTDSSVLNISNGGTLVASAFSDTTNATNITSGTLNNARLPATLTGQTYNGLTNTANGIGFSIAGGTLSKTLNISNTLTLAGTDSSVLNIGNGGTLVASAFSDTTNATNITVGTLNNSRLPGTLTGQTYNGLTNSALATGFSIAGGTASKTLNISNTLTLSGVDSSVLNIGNGGTLVASAFSDTTNATNITSGTLNNARLPLVLTGQTYNGLTNTSNGTGFTISGGTVTKSLILLNTLAFSGVDSSTLNIGNGGTLVASAFSDTTNATNITAGTLNNARLPVTLTGQTYNGLTNTANGTGFSIAGGTLSKTLNVSNTLTLAGTDSSVLNIANGGTLVASAFSDTTNATNITAGTLNNSRLPSILTGQTYNGLSHSALATGFSIAGGTASKTLTVSNTMTIQGTDTSTYQLNNIPPALSGVVAGSYTNTNITVNGQGIITAAATNIMAYASAYSTVSQTCSVANTFQTITLNTNGINSGTGFVSNAFTCTVAGIYKIYLQCNLNGTAVGGGGLEMAVRLMKTGAEIAGSVIDQTLTTANRFNNITTSVIVQLAVNDTITGQFTASTTSGLITVGYTFGTVKSSAYITIQQIA